MAAQDPVLRRLSAQNAAQRRWKRPTHEVAAELAEVRLAQYIKQVVDAAPPLTTEQCERLSALLRPGVSLGGSR